MPSRQPALDLAKTCAAWLIVLHHAVLYGPLAEALSQAWPDAAAWLTHYGRYAVQVFLVIGGYLAAQGLMAQAPGSGWGAALARRHTRLALPFMAAVLLVLLAHVLTQAWLPELAPTDVTITQILAHALLLHGALGFESLTVGAWYVAIDFQLYALLALLLTAGPARAATAWRWGLVAALAIASLWVFNRDAGWDAWGLYFFGSYALGAGAAAWGRLGRHSGPQSARWRWLSLAGAVAVLGIALALAFRGRLVLASVMALALLALQRWPWQPGARWQALWQQQGARSYALFLVHFAACLGANAAFVALGGQPGSAALAGALLLALLLASGLLAHGFHLGIERPLARWQPLRWVHAAPSAGATRVRALGLGGSLVALPLGLAWLLELA
jgi:peptidoglycan/LPS O-acetylase OafA/YrhL